MGDIFIRFVSFPTLRVYGVTQMDENGDYNIFIDERLSNERKLETYRHEMMHIKKNHFSKEYTACDAEKEALKVTSIPDERKSRKRKEKIQITTGLAKPKVRYGLK